MIVGQLVTKHQFWFVVTWTILMLPTFKWYKKEIMKWREKQQSTS